MKVTSNLLKRYGPYQATEMLDGTADTALYHAIHTGSGRVVLLRVLSVRSQSTDASVQRSIAQCVAEIELLAQLKHPNLLSVLDYGVDGKYIYMAYANVGAIASQSSSTARTPTNRQHKCRWHGCPR